MNLNTSRNLNIALGILVVLLTVAEVGYGAGECWRKSRLYFANGMFTSFEEAQKSWTQLWEKMRVLRGVEGLVRDAEPNIAFNTDQTVLLQIAEAMDQKRDDLRRKNVVLDSGSMFRLFSQQHLAPDFLVNISKSIRGLFDEFVNRQRRADIAEQVAAYRKSLEEGYNTLTVSHSQGNFFSNEAYEKVMFEGDNGGFKGIMMLISVATPASKVSDTRFERTKLGDLSRAKGPGDTPYIKPLHITLKQDRIIRAVPKKLPPNWSDEEATGTGHDFVRHYLSGSAWDFVMLMIRSAIDEMFEKWVFENNGEMKIKIKEEFLIGSINSEDPVVQYERAYMHELVNGLHSSLMPVWHWMHRHIHRPQKLSVGQCMAGMAFMDVISGLLLKCSEQADAVLKWFDDCPALVLKARREDLEWAEMSYCTSYNGHAQRGRGGGHQYGFKANQQRFLFSKSPECWAKNATGLKDQITDAAITEGRQFMESLIVN